MKTLSRTLISASCTLGFAWPKFAQIVVPSVRRTAAPRVRLLFHFRQCLPLAERLAVQVDVAAVQPLAVMQPAAGEIQGVGVVIAEEPRRQLHHPDPASLVDPGRDLLGALDQHVFARRRPVGDAAVLVPAAARGLDPFAIRSAVNGNRIARLGRFRRLADRQVRAFGGARVGIVPGLCHMKLTAPLRRNSPQGPLQCIPASEFCKK